MKLLDVRVIS